MLSVPTTEKAYRLTSFAGDTLRWMAYRGLEESVTLAACLERIAGVTDAERAKIKAICLQALAEASAGE